MIRFMEQQDFESVHRLMEQLHGLHVQNRPDVYRDGDPLSKDEFCALLSGPEKIALVAEFDGVVAGLCIASLKQPQNSILMPQKAACLDALCVGETYRRRGVGKALMRAMEQAAREACAEELKLTVWSFNQGAIAFYEAMGMSPRNIVLEKKLR
jgi:ribosomal protein S18 acetylase RimI-like enzyme